MLSYNSDKLGFIIWLIMPSSPVNVPLKITFTKYFIA